MTTTLVELTANIVTSHAAGTKMSREELLQEINTVFTALKQLEAGEVVEEVATEPAGPALTFKQAFKADQVGCMICGKTGFKTLTRHLKQVHDLKPGEYRKQFNIHSSQSLTAKNYSEARRQAANENNLAANLEKARAVRAAKRAPVPVAPAPVAAEKVVKKATPATAKPKRTTKSKSEAK